MIIIQRPMSAQRRVCGGKVTWATISAVPFGNENADIIRQTGKLADQGAYQINLGTLFVHSVDSNVVIAPVRKLLVVGFDLHTIERAVGLQAADDMPIL